MSLVNSMLGRKSGVQEFTSVSAIPAISSPIGLRFKQKMDKRRRKLKEDGVIPDDAEPIDPNSGLADDSKITSDERDGSIEVQAELGQAPQPSNLLPTSLALVAPDCTPDWDVPLSPGLLPKSKAKPLSSPPPVDNSQEIAPKIPDVQDNSSQMIDKPISVEGMLGLGRGSRNSSSSTTVIPGITNMIQEAKTGDQLMGQGQPMPEHKTSNSSASVLKKFRFGG